MSQTSGTVPKMTALSPKGHLFVPRSPNVDSERGFSILGEIHTDQRPSVSQETLIQLLTVLL